jgi:hypothetical protein
MEGDIFQRVNSNSEIVAKGSGTEISNRVERYVAAN